MTTTITRTALAVALAATIPTPARGQEAAASPKVGCLAGRPLPACKTFWIVELQGSMPLAQSSREVDYGGGQPYPQESFDYEIAWNLGHMVNVTPTLALGGLFTVGTGNSDALTGIRLRARRWMSEAWSVEVGGGMLRTNASSSRFPGVNGATADLRLNIRDHGSFFVRWDGVDLPAQRYPETGYDDPGGFQQAFSVGADLGSTPALVGTGVLVLGYAVLLGVYLGVDS